MTPATLRILALGLLAVPAAQAQSPAAPLTARAAIVTPMAVNKLSDLDFGTVLPGVAKTIAPTQAAAGEWQIIGTANGRVIITFILPTRLTNVQSVPGITMPITFLNNSARWRRTQNSLTGGTQFNPASGAVGRIGPPANPYLYLWIGGRVTPSPTQLPGIYRGTIVVNLVYQ